MQTLARTKLLTKTPHRRAEANYYGYTPSPIGELLLVGSQAALVGLYIREHTHCPTPPPGSEPDDGRLDIVRVQLAEYFNADRTNFDLDITLQGTTFQLEVWAALADIPYGETASYGEIARQINRPKAVRAVGAANGANPVSIIFPCHRVIGSNGTMTGYGWGIDVKEWLLNLESQHLARLA